MHGLKAHRLNISAVDSFHCIFSDWLEDSGRLCTGHVTQGGGCVPRMNKVQNNRKVNQVCFTQTTHLPPERSPPAHRPPQRPAPFARRLYYIAHLRTQYIKNAAQESRTRKH